VVGSRAEELLPYYYSMLRVRGFRVIDATDRCYI
jgi:hypothetical protein